MLVLAVGSAVNAQQQRNLGAFHVTEWISQQAMNVGAVFALESNFLALRNLKFGHQRIVLMSKRLELHFAADDTGGINLVVMVIVARDHHRARSRAMTLSQNDGLIGDRNSASRADRNACAVGGHIIGHDGVNILAILAPPGL